MSQKHLIGKQILEIEVDSSSEAYAIQQKLSEFVQKELTPALEKLFDGIVDADIMVRLDTIDIDIGNIAIENTDFNEVINRIINLLEKTIRDKLESANSLRTIKKPFDRKQVQQFLDAKRNTFSSEKGLDFDQNNANYTSYAKKISSIDNESSQRSISQRLRRYYFEAWIYWLEKGVLPSNVIPPEENWMLFVLETLGLDLDAVTILEKKIKKSVIALERLIIQHFPKDLKSIAELYTGFSLSEILKMISEIKLITTEHTSILNKKGSVSFRDLEIKIWEKIFEIVILKRQKLDSISLGIEVIKHLFRDEIVSQVELRKIVLKKDKQKKEGKDYVVLREIVDAITIYDVEDTSQNEVDLVNSEEEGNLVEQERIEEDSNVEEELASPQYFNNAGMVLLHPFLGNFFKNLNLTEGKEFKNFETKSKAVLLLHFLATGEEQPQEYDMVLPKFLCEMPVNRPLDHTVEITKKEKEEANSLLEVVVEHWGALGGSSPDALREGFLIREGKLEKEQTGWKLYVEQKTLDVLLDKLPWNISIIKLPWMKEIMTVEWR